MPRKPKIKPSRPNDLGQEVETMRLEAPQTDEKAIRSAASRKVAPRHLEFPASPEHLELVARKTPHLEDVSLVLDVRHALSRLPYAQAQTIRLVDLEGWTIEEAAERQGIPVGTARSRRERGKARLKHLLSDYAPQDKPKAKEEVA